MTNKPVIPDEPMMQATKFFYAVIRNTAYLRDWSAADAPHIKRWKDRFKSSQH